MKLMVKIILFVGLFCICANFSVYTMYCGLHESSQEEKQCDESSCDMSPIIQKLCELKVTSDFLIVYQVVKELNNFCVAKKKVYKEAFGYHEDFIKMILAVGFSNAVKSLGFDKKRRLLLVRVLGEAALEKDFFLQYCYPETLNLCFKYLREKSGVEKNALENFLKSSSHFESAKPIQKHVLSVKDHDKIIIDKIGINDPIKKCQQKKEKKSEDDFSSSNSDDSLMDDNEKYYDADDESDVKMREKEQDSSCRYYTLEEESSGWCSIQ